MYTTKEWIEHFQQNATRHRVDFLLTPTISQAELVPILHSLQAWQLGETSDGFHLLKAATIYASKIGDAHYTEAVRLFIKEEQKHGSNLGKYLDALGKPRIGFNWGDQLFRTVRYFNTNMEIWTLAVISVESTAQLFYQALKDASSCQLLRQICTDILVDEAYHIRFQAERLRIIFNAKNHSEQYLISKIYPLFFMMTASVVWFAHRKAFKAGGLTFHSYLKKMQCKIKKCLPRPITAFHRRMFNLPMKSQIN